MRWRCTRLQQHPNQAQGRPAGAMPGVRHTTTASTAASVLGRGVQGDRAWFAGLAGDRHLSTFGEPVEPFRQQRSVGKNADCDRGRVGEGHDIKHYPAAAIP
jgi:hypothetical protein